MTIVVLHILSAVVSEPQEVIFKTLLRQVYTSEVQSKCKFVQDDVLHACNHEDKNHISQVILNGIGYDPCEEMREQLWASLSIHVKQLMQEHRNKLVQKLKHKLQEGEYSCWLTDSLNL